MNIRRIAIVAVVVFLFALGIVVYNTTQGPYTSTTPIIEPLLGGDKDEHGCIPSAGYTWCDTKQKCIRAWEEVCETDDKSIEIQALKTQIKAALVAKHGDNALELDITVSELSGNYAKGGASKQNFGGGMWFAAKVNNKWQLVWDGNGIITCQDIKNYPDLPALLIPQCFDKDTQKLIVR